MENRTYHRQLSVSKITFADYCPAHWISTDDTVERWRDLPCPARRSFIHAAAPHKAKYVNKIAVFNTQVPLLPNVEAPSTMEGMKRHSGWSLDARYYGWKRKFDEEKDRNKQRSKRRSAQTWNRMRRDHPNTAESKPNLKQPFRYFLLPVEIRTKILHLALTNQKELRHMPEDRTTNDDILLPVDLRILAVSKQMKAEAEPIFYQSNVFRIDLFEQAEMPLWVRQ